jgi:hypothetical protein
MFRRASTPTPDESRPAAEPIDGDAPRPAASGRAAFDRRGTTVWEWRTETGSFSRDASTTRVQKLAAPDLMLEKTLVTEQPDIDEPKLTVAACGGFNPYDRALPVHDGAAARQAAIRRPPARPVVLPPRKPVTFLEHLRAWWRGD